MSTRNSRERREVVGKGIGGLYEGHKRKRRRRGAEMSFLEKWWVVVGKEEANTLYYWIVFRLLHTNRDYSI